MKTLRSLFLGLVLAFAAGSLAPATARAQDETPSFDYFYEALSPYGEWVEIPDYGYCWQPAGVDEGWQPYTDGYWAYTDSGWTWVSYEDYGWITYHYGRWSRVEDFGWVWVPDYEWAPAWVSWRESRDEDSGDSYIGWAPLPPEVHFRPAIGISFWVDSTYDIGPGYFNFCRVRDFGAPVLRPVIIDRRRNFTIINNTVNITNITVNNNIIYNGGPNYRNVSRRVDPARPIRALQLVRQTDPNTFRQNGGKGGFSHAKGNQLFVAAPQLTKPTQPVKPAKVARVFDKPKMDHGWKGVADQKQKDQIQNSIHAQTKGIKPDQPAKAVLPAQLAVIPKGTPPPEGNPTPAPGMTNTGTNAGQNGRGPGGKNNWPGKNGGQPTPVPNVAGAPTPTPSVVPPGKKGRIPGPVATPVVQQPNLTVQPTPTPPTPNAGGKKGRFTPGATPVVQQPNLIVQPTPTPAGPTGGKKGFPQKPVVPTVVQPTPPPQAVPTPAPGGKGRFQKPQFNTPNPGAGNNPAQNPNAAQAEQDRVKKLQAQQQQLQQQKAAAASAAAAKQQQQQNAASQAAKIQQQQNAAAQVANARKLQMQQAQQQQNAAKAAQQQQILRQQQQAAAGAQAQAAAAARQQQMLQIQQQQAAAAAAAQQNAAGAGKKGGWKGKPTPTPGQ